MTELKTMAICLDLRKPTSWCLDLGHLLGHHYGVAPGDLLSAQSLQQHYITKTVTYGALDNQYNTGFFPENQFVASDDNLVIEVALVLVTVSVYGTEQPPTPAKHG